MVPPPPTRLVHKTKRTLGTRVLRPTPTTRNYGLADLPAKWSSPRYVFFTLSPRSLPGTQSCGYFCASVGCSPPPTQWFSPTRLADHGECIDPCRPLGLAALCVSFRCNFPAHAGVSACQRRRLLELRGLCRSVGTLATSLFPVGSICPVTEFACLPDLLTIQTMRLLPTTGVLGHSTLFSRMHLTALAGCMPLEKHANCPVRGRGVHVRNLCNESYAENVELLRWKLPANAPTSIACTIRIAHVS